MCMEIEMLSFNRQGRYIKVVFHLFKFNHGYNPLFGENLGIKIISKLKTDIQKQFCLSVALNVLKVKMKLPFASLSIQLVQNTESY